MGDLAAPLAPYLNLDEEACHQRIAAARKALGKQAVILGHHYQADDIIQWADLQGDSFKLARDATALDAQYIVFCGVHFMAESADIVAKPHQQVILPDLEAGCSMADMATAEQVEHAWDLLNSLTDETIVPVTYMNSSAAIKAFCGRNGGIVCTSSNARKVLDWAFARGQKVLFIPDEHLGRNTGEAMGIPLEQMPVYDPLDLSPEPRHDALRQARIVLWKGYCSVHQMFRPEHVDAFRQAHPNGRVIVHPECCREVVQKADEVGSTEQIIRSVAEASSGAELAIGTEFNLVRRLALRHPDKTVRNLSPHQCLCATMYRIDPAHLLWALENLAAGRVVNRIVVDARTKQDAKTALERMLALAK